MEKALDQIKAYLQHEEFMWAYLKTVPWVDFCVVMRCMPIRMKVSYLFGRNMAKFVRHFVDVLKLSWGPRKKEWIASAVVELEEEIVKLELGTENVTAVLADISILHAYLGKAVDTKQFSILLEHDKDLAMKKIRSLMK